MMSVGPERADRSDPLLFSGGEESLLLRSHYHRLRTLPLVFLIVIVQLLLQASLLFGRGNRMPEGDIMHLVPKGEDPITACHWAMCAHAVSFLVYIVLHRLLIKIHIGHRNRGFLTFYRSTKRCRQIIPVLSAIINTALILIYVIIDRPLPYIELTITMETVVVLVVAAYYSSLLLSHNSRASLPDAYKQMGSDMWSLSKQGQQSRVEDLDLIHFLTERNEHLTARLSKVDVRSPHNSVNITDEDAHHLLEAANKDVRLLTMERDQLAIRLEDLEIQERARQQRADSAAAGGGEDRDKAMLAEVLELRDINTDLQMLLQIERDTAAKSQRLISDLQRTIAKHEGKH